MELYIKDIKVLGYLCSKGCYKSYILSKYYICEYSTIYLLSDFNNRVVFSTNDSDKLYSYLFDNGYTFVINYENK